MANISIKKDFVDGEKLFAQQLNNNFDTIEKGVNAGNKIIWKDDNGAEIQSFRGTTAEVAERPIIDGQTLYNIETGETALDYGEKRISTGAGNVVYIGDEEPTNDATKIWISNDDIEGLGSEVAIGPEEPTTGEEVWVQRGKNLIDVNNSSICFPYGTTYNVLETGYRATLTLDNKKNRYFAVELDKFLLGKKITLSATISPSSTNQGKLGIFFGTRAEPFLSDVKIELLTTGSATVTIPSNFPSGCDGLFLLVYSNQDGDALAGSYVDYTNLQLELGEVATSYEPYITKKIHTKTDNGYEEFYSEKSNRDFYSLGETRIGTYLGKPLYRNVITGSIDDNATLVSNVDILLDAKGTGVINGLQRAMPYFEIWNNLVFSFLVNKNTENEIKMVSYKAGEPHTPSNCNIVLEYTKITD